MFANFFNLFFTWMFFFEMIRYNNKGVAGQEDNVRIQVIFRPRDLNPRLFIKEQLGPVFEDLSKCVDWDFYPIYSPQYATYTDELYQCAYDKFRLFGRGLAKFFVCMITGGDQLSHAQDCATKANIDWPRLEACKLSDLHLHGDNIEINLQVMLNGAKDSNLTMKFKDTVCTKLKTMGKPCAGCPPS